MSQQIYALLVGINDYSPSVGRLTGCLNDVDNFHGYLQEVFEPDRLHVEVLKDSDATRDNIIEQFREHLGRAQSDDVAVFQYCGHGARSKSAAAFAEFYPDGMDEGLVCYDSRTNGYDLADKELAALLAELAKKDPHIALVLDCCHSGSATRSADDFTQLKARFTHEVLKERPLESYVGGYFAERLGRGESLEIPASRHILLAACQRVQKAWEAKDHSGVFTSTLLEVLTAADPGIAYADLFVRCRAAVRKRADNQDPQFETYRGFSAYQGFLSDRKSASSNRYSVYFDSGKWQVDCGALHGLPSDPDHVTELALYSEPDPSDLAGRAVATSVGPQKSELELVGFQADTSTRFQGEITSLPVPPLQVHLEGESQALQDFETFLAESENPVNSVAYSRESPRGTRYTVIAEDGLYSLRLRQTGRMIQAAQGYTRRSAEHLHDVLQRVATWERAVGLQNRGTRLNPDDVPFVFTQILGDEGGDETDESRQQPFPTSEITFDIAKRDNDWQFIQGKLTASNRSRQTLHLLLLHFSEDFGIQPLYNERIEPTDSEFTVTLDGNSTFALALDEAEGDEAFHVFKLIVSTEKVDDFLLGQQAITLGEVVTPEATRGLLFGASRQKMRHENEWFTKDLTIRLVRQVDRIQTRDTSLAGGKITIKGHPSLQAGIGLTSAPRASRGVGSGDDVYRFLQRQGMELLEFARSRGGAENVLELTDIRNTEALAEQPLEVEINVELDDDEMLLPVTFDGEFLHLTGSPSRDESGRTHVAIHEIPDIPDNRRSLGKALKLYFFKTYLRRERVNKLRRVEYDAAGSVDRIEEGVAEAVANAQNILLLVHGIIGDTRNIAEGLRLATDQDGIPLDQKFDLVLTYDYENLGTPIDETASLLKQHLDAVGLREGDQKRLTLLVHSMGGLVSRWFIEREGGNRVVDHLVMCGTPNVGSPFGNINGARNLATMLTTVALNACPIFAPFGGALLYVFNRSAKISPTLEQMNPRSDFIRNLNASEDPGVRYTIVAGDIRDYKESADELMKRLVARIGKGIVLDSIFGQAGHDIAVSKESILGVADERTPAPLKDVLSCHHLNYFSCDVGLEKLKSLTW